MKEDLGQMSYTTLDVMEKRFCMECNHRHDDPIFNA